MATTRTKAETRKAADRRPLAGPLAQAAYDSAWQAWSVAPEATRGKAPEAPVAAADLLLDIALSLRKLVKDDDTDEAAAAAYDARREEIERGSAKVTKAEEDAARKVAEAKAALEETEAKAAEEVAKARGEKLATGA